MKNLMKCNGSVIVIFSDYEGVRIHSCNIDLKVNRLYFNYGSKELLNGVTDNRNLIEFDADKYSGKFNTALDFNRFELSGILKTILA